MSSGNSSDHIPATLSAFSGSFLPDQAVVAGPQLELNPLRQLVVELHRRRQRFRSPLSVVQEDAIEEQKRVGPSERRIHLDSFTEMAGGRFPIGVHLHRDHAFDIGAEGRHGAGQNLLRRQIARFLDVLGWDLQVALELQRDAVH